MVIALKNVQIDNDFLDNVALGRQNANLSVDQWQPLPSDPSSIQELRRQAREFVETHFPIEASDE